MNKYIAINKIKPWGCTTPKLTKDDAERLNPIRANGSTLYEYLTTDDISKEDVMKLIILEFLERGWERRDYILSRLYSRLSAIIRAEADRALTESLKA